MECDLEQQKAIHLAVWNKCTYNSEVAHPDIGWGSCTSKIFYELYLGDVAKIPIPDDVFIEVMLEGTNGIVKLFRYVHRNKLLPQYHGIFVSEGRLWVGNWDYWLEKSEEYIKFLIFRYGYSLNRRKLPESLKQYRGKKRRLIKFHTSEARYNKKIISDIIDILRID